MEHRKFTDTVVDENGNLHAVDGPNPPCGKRDVKHRKFEDTVVDENGNLHAIPKVEVADRPSNVKSHRKFADTIVDENGNLHAVPLPGPEEG